MASVKYTFNKLVNSSKLSCEIRSSAIIIACERVDVNGNLADIWMKSPLTSTDQKILSDIVNAHSPIQDSVVNLYDISNKGYVHATSRPIGTTTCFSGIGDDTSSPSKVGGGVKFKLEHSIGDPLEHILYIDLNVKQNKTYVHEGYIHWKDFNCDEIFLHIVPMVTAVSIGVNTYYDTYNGVIVPAAGNGHISINPSEIRLVEMPPYEMQNGKRPLAFWNATYNPANNTFTNISAAPNGDGVYNMFSEEITLNTFANNLMLLGNGFMKLQTSDADEFGCGMRFKFVGKTVGNDHAWKATCSMTMHRKKTC